MRNILFWALVVVALIGGLYSYFAIKQSKKPQVEALAVMPDSCLVYLNTNDFFELNKKIRSQSLIADKLRLFGEVNLLCQQLQKFDSLFSSYELLKNELEGNPVHAALYGKNADWLAAFNIKQLGDQGSVSEGLGKVLNAKSGEQHILSFLFSGRELFYNIEDGIVRLSNNTSLIKNSLDRHRARLVNSSAYAGFKTTLSEDNLLSVFVNHELYASTKSVGKLNLGTFCKKGFSAGQVDLEPSGLKVNGFSGPDSSEILFSLTNQESQSPQEIMLVLPRTMIAFKAFGFSSFSQLAARFAKTEPKASKAFWSGAGETAMYNVQNEFRSNAGNHLVAVETSIPGQDFVALEVNDTTKAIEHLRLMSDTAYGNGPLKMYRLKGSRSELKLFAPLLDNSTGYACIFNSFILFAQKENDLRTIAAGLAAGTLALNNESFNYYRSQNFPDEYNYLVYSSPAGNRRSIEQLFKFTANTGTDPFKDMRHFSFSLTNDASAFKFRLQLLNEAESNAQYQNVLWTLDLDTTLQMKPAAFVNHVTGENEILAQDEAGNLYLINAKGTVLWKKKIGEKILSEIYQVDVFKNSKFQILFNTKNHIHLIDRNGNYVKGFPIDLPAEATSPMCLFDYDKDKDYRIFIACADHAIYNYNARGLAQDGFVPVKTEHEVNLPIQYVKVGASDYLVALDREGKIYTFSRKGIGRIGLKNRSLAGCTAFYVDATNNINTTYLVCVDDKSGLINKISFGDKKELLKLNVEQGDADICFSLVDDNRDMDMVITHNGSIASFNFNGDLLFEKNTGEDLGCSSYYSDESYSFYCSLNAAKDEVVVTDPLKEKIKKIKATAMPLVSNLFNDNKKYLIVTNGRQLSCVPLD